MGLEKIGFSSICIIFFAYIGNYTGFYILHNPTVGSTFSPEFILVPILSYLNIGKRREEGLLQGLGERGRRKTLFDIMF